MKEITQDNNFCRVFELPDKFPSGFCFGGGQLVGMRQVDWFNPIPQDDFYGDSELKPWSEYESMLRTWLMTKRYVKPGKRYLLITDFDEAMVFSK